MENNVNTKCYVSERFRKKIYVHIIKIYSLPKEKSPLILAIHGPAGEGKTYQCVQILKEMKMQTFQISASKFESPKAGEPAQLLLEKYNEAVEFFRRSDEMAVILINDLDEAIGKKKGLVQYTVNTQNVESAIMDLADDHVDDFVRIPIIVTGNDLSRIYPPTTRPGRMDMFHWQPTKEEKIEMMKHIFDDSSDAFCEELQDAVDLYSTNLGLDSMPISFYSCLKSTLVDEKIWNKVPMSCRLNYHDYKFLKGDINDCNLLKKSAALLIDEISKGRIDYSHQEK